MRKFSSLVIVVVLVIIGVLSLYVDSRFLKSQILLQPPESVFQVKLVRQSTDPVQFDIYHASLLKPSPESVSLVFINSLIFSGKEIKKRPPVIKSVLLATGTEERSFQGTSTIIRITGITSQNTTKLGTVVTDIRRDEYLSLEYDIELQGKRETFVDHPMSIDVPKDFSSVQNTFGDLLYVRSSDRHALIAEGERFFSRSSQVIHSALVLENTLTSFEKHSTLLKKPSFLQKISLQTPPLELTLGHLSLPKLQMNAFNTLIIRYRNGSGPWLYSSFFLPSATELTLPLPLSDMPDFFTDLQYSFALLSSGWNTLDQQFPYESLIPGLERPVFYRTPYVSLLPQVESFRDSLRLPLEIQTRLTPGSMLIGLVLDKPLYTLSEAVEYFRQTLPVLLITSVSTSATLPVSDAEHLPLLHMIGKLNQIWFQKVSQQKLFFLSESFAALPLPDMTASIPDLSVVSSEKGDQLLCFISTPKGSFSLGILPDAMLTPLACVQSALRSGYRSGTVYPVVFHLVLEELEALPYFSLESVSLLKPPGVVDYNPLKKIISVSGSTSSLKILASTEHTFSGFTQQPAKKMGAQGVEIPPVASCTPFCYLKLASIPEGKDHTYLAGLSETLLLSSEPKPRLQLCFTESSLFEKVLKSSDLSFQALKPSQGSLPLKEIETGFCYELILEEGTFNDLLWNTPELPPKTIVIHTNGFEGQYIRVPPQRHYLTLKTSSPYQMLETELLYHQVSLAPKSSSFDRSLQTSYQLSSMGRKEKFLPLQKGTSLLHSFGKDFLLSRSFETDAPLEESLLFPDELALQIPHSLRVILPEEVLVSPPEGTSDRIVLPFRTSRSSELVLNLSRLQRPTVLGTIPLSSGIRYESMSGLLSMKNPSGSFTIPLDLQYPKAIDHGPYEKSKTPLPSSLDQVKLRTTVVLEFQDIGQDGNTESPFLLPLAFPGKTYLERLPLPAFDGVVSLEVSGLSFVSPRCGSIFSFQKESRSIGGLVPKEETLKACFFEAVITLRQKLDYAETSISTKFQYFLPLISALDLKNPRRETLDLIVPLGQEVFEKELVLPASFDVLEDTEIPLGSRDEKIQRIAPLHGLEFSFQKGGSKLLVSGPSKDIKPALKVLRGIQSESGELVLLSLKIIPAIEKNIPLALMEGLPNHISIPQILQEKGFKPEELRGMKVLTSHLGADASLGDGNILTIQGSSTVKDQKFDVQLSLATVTIVHFPLTLKKPQTVTLPQQEFTIGKSFQFDLSPSVQSSHTLLFPQLQDFLSRQGMLLIGKPVKEVSKVTVVFIDATDLKRYELPLHFAEAKMPTTIPEPPKQEIPPPVPVPPVNPPPIPEVPLKGAAEEDSAPCFPDISLLSKEYQEAVCEAKTRGIISGSGGFFRPEGFLNRAEMAKMLVSGPFKLMGLISDEELQNLSALIDEQHFPDVPESSWFYGFVETLFEAGTVKGYPDGTFKPGNTLTIAEAAVMMMRTFSEFKAEAFQGDLTLKANTFPEDSWFEPSLRVILLSGGDLPDPDFSKAYGQSITRSQMVYNLMVLVRKAGLSSDTKKNNP